MDMERLMPINVNMDKAKVIHMDAIRVERNKELASKDITFMRAVEDADTDAQATIKAEKQTLRDIPATFDITTDVDTPEKLKAKWPTELPARE
jgi:FKBP-type peptidyl-prolyl cis-trans isomerase 2